MFDEWSGGKMEGVRVERCFPGHDEITPDEDQEARAEEEFADRMLDDAALFGRENGKLKEKVRVTCVLHQ
jgi:hypothetical protein